jgi:hypothetical protein
VSVVVTSVCRSLAQADILPSPTAKSSSKGLRIHSFWTPASLPGSSVRRRGAGAKYATAKPSSRPHIPRQQLQGVLILVSMLLQKLASMVRVPVLCRIVGTVTANDSKNCLRVPQIDCVWNCCSIFRCNIETNQSVGNFEVVGSTAGVRYCILMHATIDCVLSG